MDRRGLRVWAGDRFREFNYVVWQHGLAEQSLVHRGCDTWRVPAGARDSFFAVEAKGRNRSNLDHTSTNILSDCIGGFVTNSRGRVGEPPTERCDSRLVVDSTHDLASQPIRGNVLDRWCNFQRDKILGPT